MQQALRYSQSINCKINCPLVWDPAGPDLDLTELTNRNERIEWTADWWPDWCLFCLRFDRIAHTRETMHKDGINSLTYQVVKLEKLDLFTKITVDVGKPWLRQLTGSDPVKPTMPLTLESDGLGWLGRLRRAGLKQLLGCFSSSCFCTNRQTWCMCVFSLDSTLIGRWL